MTRIPRLVLVLCVTIGAPPIAAQNPRTPRTAEGRPDLQGVWSFSSGVPLQRPAAFSGRRFFTQQEFDSRRVRLFNALTAAARFAPVENVGRDWIDTRLYVTDLRTSLITYPDGGRLPALVAGVRRVPGADDILASLADGVSGPPAEFASFSAAFGGGRKDSYKDFNASERCLGTESPPLVPHFGENYVQIIQAPDSLALVSDSDRRIVALEATPSANTLRTWMGTSRGHWDGNTLVVETRGFNDRTPSFAGAGNALDKVVTERFTRTAADVIQYSATIVDPKTFTDRIELSFPMARVSAPILESACHEGNYSLANTLSAARTEDEQAAVTR